MFKWSLQSFYNKSYFIKTSLTRSNKTNTFFWGGGLQYWPLIVIGLSTPFYNTWIRYTENISPRLSRRECWIMNISWSINVVIFTRVLFIFMLRVYYNIIITLFMLHCMSRHSVIWKINIYIYEYFTFKSNWKHYRYYNIILFRIKYSLQSNYFLLLI